MDFNQASIFVSEINKAFKDCGITSFESRLEMSWWPEDGVEYGTYIIFNFDRPLTVEYANFVKLGVKIGFPWFDNLQINNLFERLLKAYKEYKIDVDTICPGFKAALESDFKLLQDDLKNQQIKAVLERI